MKSVKQSENDTGKLVELDRVIDRSGGETGRVEAEGQGGDAIAVVAKNLGRI